MTECKCSLSNNVHYSDIDLSDISDKNAEGFDPDILDVEATLRQN
jgi:hypothetical protein